MTKRGIVFSLDMMLAVVVVVIIIGSSGYFFSRSGEEFLGNLNMVKLGSDITYMLYEDGTLDTLDSETVAEEIELYLPENYEMRLTLEGDFPGGMLMVESNPEGGEGRFRISGTRYLVINYNGILYNAKAVYEVWVE
ncbi:MAG: hypothetical protein ABIB71_00170 [Candidatus Woesearchaeota archaeon]